MSPVLEAFQGSQKVKSQAGMFNPRGLAERRNQDTQPKRVGWRKQAGRGLKKYGACADSYRSASSSGLGGAMEFLQGTREETASVESPQTGPKTN